MEEVVMSFVLQDTDEDMELVIANDCPEQPLACDVPGVRVVNRADPIPDASLKFHWAVDQCRGETISWWEDDDISLPWRISHSVDKMAGEFYKQDRAWWFNHGVNMGLTKSLLFGTSMFTRDLWDLSCGSTPYEWADKTAYDKMKAVAGPLGYFEEESTEETAFFIYMWAGRCQHDSANGDQFKDGAEGRFKRFRHGVLTDPRFRPGLHVLRPRWPVDYVKAVGR